MRKLHLSNNKMLQRKYIKSLLQQPFQNKTMGFSIPESNYPGDWTPNIFIKTQIVIKLRPKN